MSVKMLWMSMLFGMLCPLIGGELINGGFEQASSQKSDKSWLLSLADGWTVVLHSGRKAAGAELSGDAKAGRRSLRLFTRKAQANISADQTVSCHPASDFKLSAWLKSGKSGSAKVYFRIRFLRDDHTVINKKYEARYMPGWVVKNEWICHQASFHVPAEAVRMILSIQSLGNSEPVELFVDEVKLTAMTAGQ